MRDLASAAPERVALITLPDGDHEGERLSYQALDDRASAFARWLLDQGLRGQRVLLLLPSGADFVVALLGCLYAKVVAVPAFPPTASSHARRVAHMVSDSGAAAALIPSDRGSQADTERMRAAGVHCPLLPMPREWPAARIDLPARPDDALAYLQYTSGSIAAPRGVCITHRGLADYCDEWNVRLGMTGADTCVTWLPLFHDMGLVAGVLQPLYAGASIVMMPPQAFLQRPLRWLRAIDHYRGTFSCAPNFAYELCSTAIDAIAAQSLDLSSWAFAANAAEAVHADTLERFAQRFAGAGFRPQAMNPCYGLAEATLAVTRHPRLQPCTVLQADAAALREGHLRLADAVTAAPRDTAGGPPVRRLVSCGTLEGDTEVLCVDPETLQACPPGQVGEIWVQGAGVAPGYWQQPAASSAAFHGFTQDGRGPCLRTGDLGVVWQERLYVTGRLKDLIVVRGRNHDPADIEHTLRQCHPALHGSRGAAFAIHDGGAERLVLVHEVDRAQRRQIDGDAIVQAMRAAVAREHGLQVHALQLVKPASLCLTSSGKVQRRACRESFLRGSFDVLHEWRATDPPATADTAPPTAQTLSDRLCEHLAHALSRPPHELRRDLPFAQLGLDSLQLVRLSADLSDWLGRPLDPMLLYRHPSIDSLARHLGQAAADAAPAAEARDGRTAIAVVGMACRLPGAHSVAALWHLLDDAVDPVSQVPPARWTPEDVDVPGFASTRHGGFIDGVDEFDPRFFDISPREADAMDPQQRWMLQTTWHALEDAGIPPHSLAGSDTGVFVGVNTHDYGLLATRRGAITDAMIGTGTHASIIANRVSYLLDLHGPSVAIETACSSSFVALHNACSSLRAGESSTAIVGGVSMMLCPELPAVLSRAGMLSPSGRCRAFDAGADGYVRSEGCIVVVLKRLDDALRDHDRIHGLVLGSAVNQDGRSNGLTAPNGAAQERVIRKALAAAAISAGQVGYVEAHGTGTPLGDPIETEAIRNAYGAPSGSAPALWIGSIKSNVGHLEPAAGLAGLLKVLLAMRHERLPQNLHLVQLNPRIRLEGSRCAIVDRTQPWRRGAAPRIAGISSFGFGGTNVHVIVQEPPPPPSSARPAPAESAGLFTLSASSAGSLRRLAGLVADSLDAPFEGDDPAPLPALCHTSTLRRSHLAHRVAVVCRSRHGLSTALRRFSEGDPGAPVQHAAVPAPQRGDAAFVFTDMPLTCLARAAAIAEGWPAFRSALLACDAIWRRQGGRALWPVPGAGADCAEPLAPAHEQALAFAVAHAAAMAWHSVGMDPSHLIGEGVGEYVAACFADVFDLDDALRLLAARAQAMAQGHSAAAVRRFAAVAAGVRYRPPSRPVVSSLTGRAADAGLASADHWVRQLGGSGTVGPGVAWLQEQGCRAFIEIGLAPATAGRASCPPVPALWLAGLPGEADGPDHWLDVIARLHVHGVPIAWDGFDAATRPAGEHPPQPVALPPYPFERQRHWLPPAPPPLQPKPAAPPSHAADPGDRPATGSAVDPHLPAATLAHLPPAAAKHAILERLRALMASVLRWDDAEQARVAPHFQHTDLRQLGLDSLLAMEFHHAACQAFEGAFPLADFLAAPHPDAIAELLHQHLLLRLLAGPPTARAGSNEDMHEELL